MTATSNPQTAGIGPGQTPGSVTLWANRPAASAVAPGSEIIVTDVGVGSYSRWYSDGTNWRPVNGKVNIYTGFGTNAAPLGTLVGNGAGQTLALASYPTIPANMLIPGARVWCDLRAVKVGAVAAISYFGCGISATTALGGTLAASILGNSVPINAGSIGPGLAYAQVLSSTVLQSPSYVSVTGATAGYGESAVNLTVPLYVVVQCNNSLATGDSMAVVSLNVWLEF